MKNNVQTVQDKLARLGFDYKVVELPDSTHTAVDAANALSCQVAQIAKSIIFKTKNTNQAILVIASGINRINEGRLAEYISEPIEKADADFVLEKTGFVIGGVPPLGHISPIKTFIDQDLMQYDEIWAAAGSARAVFKLKPEDLFKMTNGKTVLIE